MGIEGDRVLVDGDSGLVQGEFRLFAGDSPGEDIDQNQVSIGSPGHQAVSALQNTGGQRRGVAFDLPDVTAEIGLQCFLKADGLGSHDMHQGPALGPGEQQAVQVPGLGPAGRG